ncbi:glycosyltransferase involved in cell wall biosynthesis [Povalibacter uvarum]|uniref:Glycosyltransferase involved in cell wall biosynthesis n=2 Tax=Povalibacter uvarum TaxID=732238 RepID=A0A841HGT0_9GAMM|nr:glycosyltransferase involved in cell wall biosynthesis [Povalibacter uvarum]
MKIAFLIDTISTDTAGTQKQLLEMIRRLDRTAFEPQLICLWESPWMTRNTLPCPCTVLGYRGFVKSNFPGVVRRLAAMLSEQRIDVVQTFFEDSIFVAWLGAALARPRPVLLSSRRDIGLGRENQPWYHGLFGRALPYVNRTFAGIVANSEQVRQYVSQRERTPLSKIKVHYNGVAFPDANITVPAPDLLATHANDVWIGIVASLTPVKRHDLLIRSFARLGAASPARLLLLGEGPQRATLEALARECGVSERVHFEGAVKDVGAYLRHVDIGVLCSDREGLSNAILEYMSYALPVVATQVGGNGELVNADNGVIVPPDDVDAMASALQRLVGDRELRGRLGRTSREKALTLFSWEKSMSDIEAYYRSLVQPVN